MIAFAKDGESLHGDHLNWLQSRIGSDRGWDSNRTVSMGWYRGQSLKSVVIFHDYAPEYQSICMSAASTDKRWLTRETLYKMHRYPFEDADCRIAVLQVSENNATMLAIAGRFGYNMTRIPHLRGPDEAEIVCVLDRDTWRCHKATTTYLAKT